MPPATSILPFARSVAVCARTLLDRLVVAAQLVPFQRSAVASDVVPSADPPAASTCPLPRTAVDNSVAVWPTRAEVIDPAEGNVGVEPDAGIVKTKESASIVEPD